MQATVVRKIFLVALLAFSAIVLKAQVPSFNMILNGDTTITECKGKVYDSGGPSGIYSANEHSIFRICSNSSVTLNFSFFDLEAGSDSLYVYDGTSLIGGYTGQVSPGAVTATSGCMVLVFVSDFALNKFGFAAQWTSVVAPPVPPTFSVSPQPACSTNTVDLLFSRNIHCDSLTINDFSVFSINNTLNPLTTAVAGLICVNDSTQSVRVTLSAPLTINCEYVVRVNYSMLDNCDSLWTFILRDTSLVNDCPFVITATALPSFSVCANTCTQVTASVAPTGCLAYNYYWSHGLPNGAVQSICPTASTIYTVSVQPAVGGPIQTKTILVSILSPTITFPGQDTTICQSVKAFTVLATPPGGSWSGAGMLITKPGTFNPDSAGGGLHTIYYTIGGQCKDSLRITVNAVDAGLAQASCPGAPSFMLSGGTPPGGAWSGTPFVTGGGLFNPSTIGSYTVVYTSPNGCTESKVVTVGSLNINSSRDTICESIRHYQLNFSPPGGTWLNNNWAFSDLINGIIQPQFMNPGNQNFVYSINGCTDTIKLYLKPSDVGGNFVVCQGTLADTLRIPDPPGGTWATVFQTFVGPSGLQTNWGFYDPSVPPNNSEEWFQYTAPNGCIDTLRIYTRSTEVSVDTLFYCSTDMDSVFLNAYRTPGGGLWTGPALISYPPVYDRKFYFKPSLAGPGLHTLLYTANNCTDTLRIVVYPGTLSFADTSVCSIMPTFPIDLQVIGNGIKWYGYGIVNADSGLFNPAITGSVTSTVYYTTRVNGCGASVDVTVYQFTAAQINGLNTTYCFNDSAFNLSVNPTGGVLSGPGIVGNTFNPSIAGNGAHQIVYYYVGSGGASCSTSDTIQVTVYPAITTTLTATNDSLCIGDNAIISLAATTGVPFANITYAWNNGLPAINTHQVFPSITTTYIVNTNDNCSDEKTDSITILVYPTFSQTATTTDTLCYGLSGTAAVTVVGAGSNYAYSWSTNPAKTTASITGLAGNIYTVKITDKNSGCFIDTVIKIPSYTKIKSLFSVNPKYACIPYEQRSLTMLDLSLNAQTGFWIFSNGDTIPFVKGVNPQITLQDPGNYSATLLIYNEGGCTDESSVDICILEPTSIFIPDIFSPNGDGLNDVFYVRGKGIRELKFVVYDRWGEKVFETKDSGIGWDGTFRGKDVPAGVYIWLVEAELFDETEISEKGNLTLVR
ncbi:MAG: gliding motility-associated C-terminal domain-containing protein [Bacteroidetes bacterium]|nr:gliding motility-associated C-terminal domain-containing protein [Bacteroidota bacterium]